MSTKADDIRIMTQRAQAVKRKHESDLLSRPNVVGVGVGYCQRGGKATGEIGIVVMVDRKVSPQSLGPGEIIPDELEGVPVDVQEAGHITAQ
ncbi:MAG: hypothetical protein R3248_04635 [Candidatus Promineifilaceae bacterium]|nr:hypothetical protein [Candidatus Promineifilaceae bacterium]